MPDRAQQQEKRKRGGGGAKGEAPPQQQLKKSHAKRPRARKSVKNRPDGTEAVRKLAAEHWPPSGGGSAFDEAVIKRVYASFLSRPPRGRDASHCLSALELSGYLERYLWPNLKEPASASFEHVMSVVALVNLKAREGVPSWAAFSSEPERFAEFFVRVVDLPSAGAAAGFGYDARALWTAFFVHAFASLEDAMVRAQALKLVSLPMWSSLAPKHLASQLAGQPQLARPWKFLQKRTAKEAKMERPPASSRQEREFMPNLLREFLRALAVAGGEEAAGDAEEAAEAEEAVEEAEQVEADEAVIADEEEEDAAEDGEDGGNAEGAKGGEGATSGAAEGGGGRGSGRRAIVRYLERSLELIIDLLAQLPTRRFFHAVLLDQHVLERCKLSAFASASAQRGDGDEDEARLFKQLLSMATFYEQYEIDDHRGQALSESEVKAMRSEQLQALQRCAFRMEGLHDFALSNLSAIDSASALRGHFSRLSPSQLSDLTASLGLTHTAEAAEAMGKPFLVQLLVSRYERRIPQHESIAQLPLYPNESTPWDTAVVPSTELHAANADSCLALPKLNLQFLTLTDYLMRNYQLFKLESTHEIKEDLEDVVTRLSPRKQLSGKTVFHGWARMALPLASVKVYKVGQPLLGETKPSEVKCEAEISLAGCRPDVQAEWSSLRKHDVVFLLTIDAAVAEGGRPETDPGVPFPERVGLVSVRGAEVVRVTDDDGNVYTGESENDAKLRGNGRKLDLLLDTAQYHADAQAMAEGSGGDVYGSLNVLVRRKPKENNFKAILSCIRELMTSQQVVVPEWLQDVLLGYGDPASAAYHNLPDDQRVVDYDFFDTFLDLDHVRQSFPGQKVVLKVPQAANRPPPPPPYRLTIPPSVPRTTSASVASAAEAATAGGSGGDAESATIVVEPYDVLVAGPYPEDQPRMNPTRFTPLQVEALRAAMNPGLCVVVGPPGTGKTDTAVQIISNLCHTFPTQRTLIVTHSNQALNDVFEKLLLRDVDERYMLRMGHGEELLETEKDFSRLGRVNHMLSRRLELLVKVERLGKTLDVSADVGYTCETAEHFYHSHVLAKWEAFTAAAAKLVEATGGGGSGGSGGAADGGSIALLFPFTDFFSDAPQPLFRGENHAADLATAHGCFRHLKGIFAELDECRAFEILRSSYDRGNYLLTKHAKVIAMTCTHAAIKRKDLVALGFQYDNLVMEEAAQVMEVETFIPMVLQNPDPATGKSRLKRIVLIGDHHQLPPVVKNAAFQKYSKLDQSLFARFVRLGVPATTLDLQGRARASLADLYRWRYDTLADLPAVAADERFQLANPGFARPFQFVDVADLDGVGESSPVPYYIQNLAEAEFVVATFMYMRLQGIPASRISIITTYNGQADLLHDVVAQRCAWSPIFGTPAKIATTDKFQGQQNDYILLSLVRTKAVGHLRDVRRLIVAMSRARLGLYVFGRRALFEPSPELRPTFAQLLSYPDKLALLPAERAPTRRSADEVPSEGVLMVDGLTEMGELVASLTERAEGERRERELAGLGAMQDAMQVDGPPAQGQGQQQQGQQRASAAVPVPPPTGGLGGGPEAPPDMDDDDD